MEDNAWLRRVASMTDFSASGDMEALDEFRNSVRELVNERWRYVEELQATLADAAGNYGKQYWTQDAINHELDRIKAIEMHLAPADWHARVAYVTRQLQDLPTNLRYEVLANIERADLERNEPTLEPQNEDTRSVRVQLRISHIEHRDLRILCKHSRRTMSEIVRLAVLQCDPKYQLFKEMHDWESRYKLNSKLFVRLPPFLYQKLQDQSRAHRATIGATLRAMLRRSIATAKVKSIESAKPADWNDDLEEIVE